MMTILGVIIYFSCALAPEIYGQSKGSIGGGFGQNYPSYSFRDSNGPIIQTVGGLRGKNLILAEGISSVNESATPPQTQGKWVGAAKGGDARSVLNYAVVGIVVLISFVGLAVFWSLSLKRQVRLRTAELAAEVHEHQQADEALRQSELELNAIYENTPLVLLLVDRNRCIIKMNALGLAMARRSAQEASGLIGGDALRCIHASDSPDGCGGAPACEQCGVRNAILQTFSTGEGVHRTKAILVYDDLGVQVKIDLLVSTRLLDISQDPLVLVCLEDVTQQKKAAEEKEKLELQLRHSLKMEAIGTLAGGIAHDFNNILGGILGYSEMALAELPEDSPIANDIKQVLAGGLRAKDLVRQILAFSRQDEHELSYLKIQAVVKDAIRLLRPSIPATVEIKQYIDQSCGVVYANSSHIHQIIMNLCTNSFHAMGGENGVLTITVDSFCQSSLDDGATIPVGQYVRLSVGDTGHGMTNEVKERIFEPFFTTKGVGEGTGLGLSVIHGLIKGFHGFVTVDSSIGEGTTFNVYFPEVNEKLLLAETQLKDLPRGHEQILIVDDEEGLGQVVARMLGSLGYKTTLFTDSQKALAEFKVHSSRYDLVITDMAMPKMSGKVLVEKIHAVRPDMKILLCTGFNNLMNKDEEKALGVAGCILKPVIKADLAKSVRGILD